MQRHAPQFAKWGLHSDQEVSDLIIQTLRTGTPINTDPRGAIDYAVRVNGEARILRIVVGENGFVVSAYPQ